MLKYLKLGMCPHPTDSGGELLRIMAGSDPYTLHWLSANSWQDSDINYIHFEWNIKGLCALSHAPEKHFERAIDKWRKGEESSEVLHIENTAENWKIYQKSFFVILMMFVFVIYRTCLVLFSIICANTGFVINLIEGNKCPSYKMTWRRKKQADAGIMSKTHSAELVRSGSVCGGNGQVISLKMGPEPQRHLSIPSTHAASNASNLAWVK